MLDPEDFQGEVMRWAMHNFPSAQVHEPLLGVVEEIGELYNAHSIIKRPENGGAEKREQEIDDAVGDIMVFLAHYCGLNGFSLISCVTTYGAEDHPMFNPFPLWGLVEASGRLCHAHLKASQKIRGNHRENAQQQIGNIVASLRSLCKNQKQELTEIVDHVWGEVKKRDWKKFPLDGGYKTKPRVRAKVDPEKEVPF